MSNEPELLGGLYHHVLGMAARVCRVQSQTPCSGDTTMNGSPYLLWYMLALLTLPTGALAFLLWLIAHERNSFSGRKHHFH